MIWCWLHVRFMFGIIEESGNIESYNMSTEQQIQIMTEKDVRKRIRLLINWGFACILCGEHFANLSCVSCEHTAPKSFGGKQDDNIAPSHFNCNRIRGTKSIIEADMMLKFKRRFLGEERFKIWISCPIPARIVPPIALMDIDTAILMYED